LKRRTPFLVTTGSEAGGEGTGPASGGGGGGGVSFLSREVKGGTLCVTYYEVGK